MNQPPDLTRMRFLAVSFLCLSLAAGCGEDAPEPPARPASHVDLDAAQEQVRLLFTAIEQRDCEGIVGVLVNADDEEHCQEFLHDTADHGMRLIEIIEAHPDGRDLDVVIVRAGVQRDDRTQQVMVRVAHRDGRWSIAF